MDTTSNALSRILHLLALHQDVQDKLREELVRAIEEMDGDLQYDQLSNLPCMDAICRETLRLYVFSVFIYKIHLTTFIDILPCLRSHERSLASL